MADSQLKQRTVKTLKWNAIDRVATQLLYAAVGIVLANILSKEDFGVVGIILAFQAFAIIFVDSGFGAALLQKKDPEETDYSTVFWFNLTLCALVYAVLWFCAPLIATTFGDARLTLICRVQFVAFILQGLGIVQTNRLMKRMDVRQIAIADTLGLVLSGCAAIVLAVKGFGVWALVWQYILLAAIRTIWLWLTGKWMPRAVFSGAALRRILPVGSSVFFSSFLNTLSLNLYTFVIGLADGLMSVGLYTQADKWSKMGITTLSQTLTSTFLPLMSKVQDDRDGWTRYTTRVNRFTSMLTLPAMIGLAAVAAPLFHLFFGQKWDEAIILFQILAVRGIFVVFISVTNNYLVAAGKKRAIVAAEVIKDVLILGAVLATVWSGSLQLLVAGQMIASALTWLLMLPLAARSTGYGVRRSFDDLLPFLWPSLLMGGAVWAISLLALPPWAILPLQLGTGIAVYGILLIAGRHPELPELLATVRKKRN